MFCWSTKSQVERVKWTFLNFITYIRKLERFPHNYQPVHLLESIFQKRKFGEPLVHVDNNLFPKFNVFSNEIIVLLIQNLRSLADRWTDLNVRFSHKLINGTIDSPELLTQINFKVSFSIHGIFTLSVYLHLAQTLHVTSQRGLIPSFQLTVT